MSSISRKVVTIWMHLSNPIKVSRSWVIFRRIFPLTKSKESIPRNLLGANYRKRAKLNLITRNETNRAKVHQNDEVCAPRLFRPIELHSRLQKCTGENLLIDISRCLFPPEWPYWDSSCTRRACPIWMRPKSSMTQNLFWKKNALTFKSLK